MQEKQLERIFKAFANRRRLAILAYLKKAGEASVGDIAVHIKLSIKATSRHLSILFASGLIEREQRSVQAFYSLSAQLPDIARRALLYL